MLKIPRKKNGKKRRDERVEQGITERKYGDCSRNGKEKAEVKEAQPARSAGWDGNDKNRNISNQKNYASKDKNSSSLIILTPSSFAFLFLEEAEAESLLIR